MKKSNSFTLIELIVVLSILSLISSIFGINIYQLVQEYRFEQTCSSVATELLATGRLARAQQGVIEIHLEMGPKGLILRRTTDEAIPVDTHFFTYTKCYKNIQVIEIDGKRIDRYTLYFTPKGMREKILTLKYREKFHKIQLHLL